MAKKLSAEDRLIVALDTDDPVKALDIVRKLPKVKNYKIGLELIFSILARLLSPKLSRQERENNLRDAYRLFNSLRGLFLDAKLHDIPTTVVGAIRSIARLGVTMISVHCQGKEKMMADAWRAAKETAEREFAPEAPASHPLILGVTLLTSLKASDFREWAGLRAEDIILDLALSAKDTGLDGVIASPLETARIRRACGPNFVIVNPGICPNWALPNDQSRFGTPTEAIQNGADYLVVGRAITNPPSEIGGIEKAADRVLEEMEEALTRRGA